MLAAGIGHKIADGRFAVCWGTGVVAWEEHLTAGLAIMIALQRRRK